MRFVHDSYPAAAVGHRGNRAPGMGTICVRADDYRAVPGRAALQPCAGLLSFSRCGVIYVGVYTLLLKPRTLVNIVIGGAAGSAAVLSGSAAVGAWNDPGALVLAVLLFAWTPTHF